MWWLIAMPDTAENRTLHDDDSIFQTLLLCLQVPEGEKGPFTSLLLIVWFPVARWRAQHTVGGREKAQVGTGACTLSLHLSQILRWLQASLSLELCRNTKQWHLTLSVYSCFFIISVFFFSSPPSQAVTDTLAEPVIVCFEALTSLIRQGHNTDVYIFITQENHCDHEMLNHKS